MINDKRFSQITYKQLELKQVTVDNTSKDLSDLTFLLSHLKAAREVIVYVRSKSINISYGEDAPTTSAGINIAEGGSFVLLGLENINMLKMIRNGADNATVDILLAGV